MIPNYVVYHLHSDDSLLDSCTKYKEYIDRAVELGQKAIAFTEHGRPTCWVKKKMYCDKAGIKFLYGVEAYLTRSTDEKVRDNYHTVLIAKNMDGILEINSAISRSFDKDHFYYTNRITFDEFFSLSKNVIKISACLASPLNKLSADDSIYERLVKNYDYLEIQPHNHPDQIAFNVHLACLSEKYHIPLIAGTDTHSLNAYKAECRSILLVAKHKSYGDEDSFDLTYKSYDELVSAFEKQDAIPKELYLNAIENTNAMADSVEEFTLDTSLKYPILYGSREKDNCIFYETIERKFQEKIENGIIPKEQIQSFQSAIEEEKRVFEKIQMDGFMLSMSELISWCKDNGIAVGNARGSVGGSRIAYVTDIIDLNPETWRTVFSRFANEDRKEVGDIDVDVIADDRPRIFAHLIERFGADKTARVSAFGTLDTKGVIDEICRAKRFQWNKEHGLKEDDKTDKNPYSLKLSDKIKSEFESDSESARKNHPDIFYYFDGLTGTKVSQSVHPAGMVISPVTLFDNYGVFEKDGDLCLWLDMAEVHECGLVKYDFLILKNVQVIRDAYRMLGKPYPKTHEIDWNDEKVWTDMLRSPVGIFQFEASYAFEMLRKFKPKSIFDMSLVTACIRPSGASYRNELLAKTPHKNPSKLIDDLLKDNLGYLVYQEDTIKFLQQICGLSGSEADNIRRAIGRKEKDRLSAAMPSILNGYCEKSSQPREVAEQEAKEFLRIIEDSASYQFGYNHSIAYCLMGYECAYLRYYHPYEFITAYLNNAANSDDITNGTELARMYGITITPPKFGISSDVYDYDEKNGIIAKGLGSVKYMNASVARELYELSKAQTFDCFTDLLTEVSKTSIDARQLSILIKIGFFSSFGNDAELLRITELFDLLKQGRAKSFKKSGLNPHFESILKRFATDRNAKGEELKSYTVTDMNGLMHECEKEIRFASVSDLDFKVKIANQKEYLGYVDLMTGKDEDKLRLYVEDVYALKDKKTGEPWVYKVNAKSVGTGKRASLSVRPHRYNLCPIKDGDILKTTSLDYYKDKKGYWNLLGYEKEI